MSNQNQIQIQLHLLWFIPITALAFLIYKTWTAPFVVRGGVPQAGHAIAYLGFNLTVTIIAGGLIYWMWPL